ncbi:MAG TPA: Hsp70 family protein, partial [Gemmatimonadota bacterium]|nr:Hsp70 family protein [Gemmatimonadota bacterium]
KEQKIRIEASSGLSEQEIERMVKDAESHADEDRRRREEAETRNQADSMLFQAERTLADDGDKLSSDTKSSLESAVERTRQALKGSDASEIRSAAEALQQAWMAAGREIHEAAQAQAAGAGAGAGTGGAETDGGGPSEPAGGEEPVEADYEVVDEEKS